MLSGGMPVAVVVLGLVGCFLSGVFPLTKPPGPEPRRLSAVSGARGRWLVVRRGLSEKRDMILVGCFCELFLEAAKY